MSKNAKLIGIYGGRGQGKSTWVKDRLKKYPRVIVFDPMDEYGNIQNYKRATSIAEVLKLMIKGKALKYNIAYVPRRGVTYPESLYELISQLFRFQQPYKEGRSSRQLCLVIEEMNLSVPSRQLPASIQDDITSAFAQGRHWGLEIIGVTQRPKMVMPNFRSLAEIEVIFKLTDYDDIATLDRKMPPAWRGKIYALEKHQFLQLEGSEISMGRNKISKK